MEKYRPFADPGTGVNPFVPVWSHHKASLPMKLVKVLVLLPLALVRLALFGVAVAFLALVEGLCMLIPIGILRYPIYRLLTSIGCTLALFALGVFATSTALADHRRLKIAPSKLQGQSVFGAGHGSLILVNQQGITDVLYLCLKVCPTFAFVATNGAPQRMSLISALLRAGARRPQAALPGKPTSLAEIAEAARSGWGGPVVVFPEGARTNGSCVLSWKAATFQGLETFDKPVGTALLSLEYSKTGAYTPHHTVGTSFRHIFWQCLQPFHTLKAVWLPPAEVSAAIKGKPVAEQWPFLRTVLVRMLQGAVEVEVGCEKHHEFMAFYDASQRKGYTSKAVKKSVAEKKAT